MQRNFTIFYTSDSHGYFSPTDYATGEMTASGLSNCINNFTHDGNTLVIDGGDTIQGSPFTYWLYSRNRGGDCVPARIMNLGGYNFVTLGNHDFNYGRKELERYINALDAVCLCANVSGLAGVEKTALVTLENGLKVGLTGVVTHYVNLWETPENLAGITITDAFTAAKAALEELKAANPDITVCIYHGGFERDVKTGALLSSTNENQGWRMCSELDFDIVLCAHQHAAAENLCIGGTHTCQPPDRARQYIRLDTVVDDMGQTTVQSKLCSPGDTAMQAAWDYLAPLEKANAEWLDTPVGHLDTPLLPSDHLDMAANGSYIANFFNQVQLEASGAELSSTSLANTVKGFSSDVTIRDIVSTYIYPNTLKTLLVNRAVLKEALERSAEYFTLDENGRLCISESFLRPVEQHFNYDYISGIEVTMDIRRETGNRVTSIKYHGEELADDKKLTLCMNNYRATGAGGYGIYANCEIVREQPTEISELIIDYVERHGSIIVDKTKWLNIIY